MSVEHESDIAYGFLIKRDSEAIDFLQKNYAEKDEEEELDVNVYGVDGWGFSKDFDRLSVATANDSWSGDMHGLIVYAPSSIVNIHVGNSNQAKAVSLNGINIPDEELVQLIDFQRKSGLTEEPGWVAWSSVF